MDKIKEADENKVQKRIVKAEKKAMKIAGVDQDLIHHFWELVNMFPKISTPELESRIERFIMTAAPGQLFVMQRAIFAEATRYLLEDQRVKYVMGRLSGKRIGLAIAGEYESTVTLDGTRFKIERGIKDGIPIISVESRKDYADAVLLKKDPIKMILRRRIRASKKFTLLRWGLPHVDLLRDRSLFEKYLTHQPEIERAVEENLEKMGY
ncbi:MAG: hypothetical protein CVT63_00955 [Candidatus Anoxymicrobium japonicum]|uniref:Uncharacterized protein n=1 Tax=Candidatus Anoxymicrobium japonicum TaxID=2013648 RepID=A0A2N3G7W0_9ACTN|nr:MAG: hypothetical protein CVT63_00955 [Candidatus Anoxymicrobium japonicum]